MVPKEHRTSPHNRQRYDGSGNILEFSRRLSGAKPSCRMICCGFSALAAITAIAICRQIGGPRSLIGSANRRFFQFYGEAGEGKQRTEDGSCAPLWGQCGGDGYDGPTCCEGDTVCKSKPLPDLPTYKQCRPVLLMCRDAKRGSECYRRVQYHATQGIHDHPEWYHGLTPNSSLREFQEYEYDTNGPDGCPAPCGNAGDCYYVFRFEGCDKIAEWMCDKPDPTLGYKCCCEYFHKFINRNRPARANQALLNSMQVSKRSTPTMFCTALIRPATYEVDLLRAQYTNGALGVFGCNAWDVYSNETLRINPEDEKVGFYSKLVPGSLKGKLIPGLHPDDPKTVYNTDVFLKFWQKVFANPKSTASDWTVKLDPDTMFLPMRLRALLWTSKEPIGGPDPEFGLYLNNCHVGMHGPIEVLSRNALKRFQEKLDSCKFGKPSEHGQEDWFLRACFDEIGVQKVNAYNLLLEGTYSCQERPSSWHPYRPPCFAPEVSFHPFKTVESYMHCYLEAANHPWQLPVNPVGVGPRASNERHEGRDA